LPRVLFLTESFHPVLGGGELHIEALGKALVVGGIPATVVTRRIEGSWPAEEALDGIRVLRVGPSGQGRMGKILMIPGAVAAIRRVRKHFDVLVVRGTRTLGVPGLALGRILGRPVALQPEINGEFSGEAYTWGKDWGARKRGAVLFMTAARNRFLRGADAFVAMSHAIEREMRAAGVPDARIRRIPHGVDLERFRPPGDGPRGLGRPELGLSPDAILVTYTGRLLRGKGLELLLEVFIGLASRFLKTTLMFVGSGAGQTLSVEPALRARAIAAGLQDRVLFTGRVHNVEDYLRASDIFVFPSQFEALGISLLEAAACGLPCVASRTGGIVDVIEHEVTGLLHEPGDAAGLVASLERLLCDRELGSRLGRAAREHVERGFDARLSIERYRTLFAELAGTPGASR